MTFEIARYVSSKLPNRKYRNPYSEPDYYGASHVIQNGLDVKQSYRKSYATWAHGWNGRDAPTWNEVDWAITNYPVSLVANHHIKNALPVCRVHVEAVGLPYIYVQDNYYSYERIPSSLLVMPAHSLSYVNQTPYEEEYLQSILPYLDQFDHVCFCLHSSCVDRGTWVKLLEKYGIAYIYGASLNDMNSLYRMYLLFNMFDTMTTNVHGSHILYAAYSGMKISVFQYKNMMMINDYSNAPFYINNKHLYKEYHEYYKLENYKKVIGQFVTTPDCAISSRKWASTHIGHSHKREYAEIAELLGWSPRKQKHYYFKYHLTGKAKRIVKRIIRRKIYASPK